VSTRTQHNLQPLIKKALHGETEAFHEIVTLLQDRLFAYALSRTRQREDALDILQETFIDLWISFDGFEYSSDEEFLGFVYIILKRKLSRHFKKRADVVEFNEQHIKDSYDILYPDYQYIEGLLGHLGEQDRELLRLRYWSDLSFAGIAAVMGISENTAKVRHHRALSKLQQIANEDNERYAPKH